MEISPFQRPVRAADLPFDQIANNPNLSEPEKAREVGRQFEAVLLRQILTEAHKPLLGGAGESTTKSVYQDMIVNNLADSISKGGSFGLAHTFQHQLTREMTAGKAESPEGSGKPADGAPARPLHAPGLGLKPFVAPGAARPQELKPFVHPPFQNKTGLTHE